MVWSPPGNHACVDKYVVQVYNASIRLLPTQGPLPPLPMHSTHYKLLQQVEVPATQQHAVLKVRWAI